MIRIGLHQSRGRDKISLAILIMPQFYCTRFVRSRSGHRPSLGDPTLSTNDSARPQISIRLTQAEARQLDDASATLRLSRNDLVRLALDDLYRGQRFTRPTDMKARLTVVRRPALAA